MKFSEVVKLSQKKSAENDMGAGDIIGFFIWKTISYFITWPLASTSITPNQVTFASMLAALSGFICMLFPESMKIKIVGVALFAVWAVLDNVDGNLARIKKQFSPNGDLWDAAAGYTAMCLMFFGMGIAAFDATKSITYYYIMLGGLSGIFTLYPRLLMHFKYHGEDNEINDKRQYGLFKVIAFNVTSPDGFPILLMLIAILLHIESLFTIGYFLLNGIICVYSSYWVLK